MTCSFGKCVIVQISAYTHELVVNTRIYKSLINPYSGC